MEQIGAGDLTARVDIAGNDEIAGLAASFNRAAAKIESLVQSHRLLLANASHELRTPLTAVQGNIDLLERQLERAQSDSESTDETIAEYIRGQEGTEPSDGDDNFQVTPS